MCCTTSVPAIERPERDFCSGQCRERFEANPGLYVGVPTQQAPRQQGKWVLKRRSFALEVPLSTEQARLLTDAVGAVLFSAPVFADWSCGC